MRIAVVGTIVADTIELPDGATAQSLGGIAHTLAALAGSAAPDVELLPVCRVGADLRDRVERFLDRLSIARREGLVADERPNPRVHLSYDAGDDSGERRERLTHPSPPLTDDEVAPAHGADATVLNCITGNDVSPGALRVLAAARRPLYLDIHSLALGTRPDGYRHYRQRSDWQDWLGAADVVQCNRAEGATVCGLDPQVASTADIRAALHAVLTGDMVGLQPGVRPSVVALTLGAAGADLFIREARGWRREHVAAPTVAVIDPTGAGDAFGAGFVAAWLRGAAPEEAGRAAVRAGSAACTCSGVPGAATPGRESEIS